MKKNNLLLGAMVAVFFSAACGNASQSTEENHEGHAHSSTEVSEEETTPASVQLKDAALNGLYQEYLTLNQALVNSSLEEAKIAAHTLELVAKEHANGSLVATNAVKIAEANTISEQREALADLSQALIALVKESGVASGEVYVDYCPMALNNTGAYWLSSEKGIQNPYFGDQMLTCGETKETI